MIAGRIFDLLGAIVGVAALATALSSSQIVGVINALFGGFNSSVKTAQGR